jgi:chaperonin GroES
MSKQTKSESVTKQIIGKIQVFDENLIVRVTQAEKTTGGIILPDSDKRTRIAVVAEVIAAGEGKILDNGNRVAMRMGPGDTILISGQAGLPLDDSILLELGLQSSEISNVFLIKQHDVVGILTK